MEIIFTLLSLFSLVGFSLLFISKLKIPDGVAPLVAVCFTMVYLVFFGMLNMLLFSAYLYFIISAAIIILILMKKIDIPKLSIWFYGFIIISSVMIVFFGIREPLLNSWDEFSFWGTAVKMMKINNELPVTAEIGWAWVASQKAGLISLGYFFEFFGDYTQWRVFIAPNIIALSAFFALLTPFKNNKKFIGILLLPILYISSYVFVVNRELVEPSNVYMTALADMPMGWIFGISLVLYYILKQEKAKLWPIPVVLLALVMIKETALPFALISWGIISFDILFLTKDITFFSFKGLKAKISHIITNLLSVLIGFLSWSYYINSFIINDTTGTLEKTEQTSMATMMIEGVKQLFNIDRTEEFQRVMDLMTDMFFNLPISMIGSCFTIMIIITAILIISAIVSNDREFSFRCLSFNILSILGFFAYYIFLGFTFVFIFKSDVNTSLVGYERYIYPYLIGWFMASVFFLCVSIINSKRKLIAFPVIFLMGVLFVFTYRYNQFIPSGMSFIDYHDGYLYERKDVVLTSLDIIEELGEDEKGKIYFISQGDNGNRWFQYSADLLPLQLEYSFGGGTLTLKGEASGLYDYELSQDEFKDYIIENECEYIFVERSDDGLVLNFKDLFSDNLESTKNGESVIYKVENINNNLTFEFLCEVG